MQSLAMSLFRRGLVPALVLLAAAPGAQAQTGIFVPHPTTPTFGGGFTYDIEAGDLDGDGDVDALVVVPSFTTVWLNDGAGNMTLHPTAPAIDAFCEGADLGDIDGDNDLDAVFACHGVDSEEQVWRNDGGGTFTPHPTTPEFGGGTSYELALGDLDGDSDLDAVVVNNDAATSVWLNDGAGNFSAHPTTPTIGASGGLALALGDLDGDSDLDLVTGGGPIERIFLNGGTGNFSPHPVTPTIDGGSVFGIALGDLDGDSDRDAVLTDLDGPSTVWLNNGSGSLTPHPVAPAPGNVDAIWVSLGDVDVDGDLDAVFGGASLPNQTWLNDGAGVLALHPDQGGFGGSSYHVQVTLADLDGDGGLDALVATGNSEIDEVYLNGALAPVPSILEIPTLSAWGATLFGALLAAFAARALRRARSDTGAA